MQKDISVDFLEMLLTTDTIDVLLFCSRYVPVFHAPPCIYSVFHKTKPLHFASQCCQIRTDFQNPFTGRFRAQFAIQRLLNIPSHLTVSLHYLAKM